MEDISCRSVKLFSIIERQTGSDSTSHQPCQLSRQGVIGIDDGVCSADSEEALARLFFDLGGMPTIFSMTCVDVRAKKERGKAWSDC